MGPMLAPSSDFGGAIRKRLARPKGFCSQRAHGSGSSPSPLGNLRALGALGQFREPRATLDVKKAPRNSEEHELPAPRSVAGAMLLSMILTLSACLQAPTPPPTGAELRAAMQALRDGNAGEASFDAALPLLSELIRSGSGSFVAGGAHLAGQLGRSECVPALVAALEHENARPANGSEHPTRAVLDALIRLGARVPREALLARPDVRFAPQVYVLSRFDPEHGAEALAQLMGQG